MEPMGRPLISKLVSFRMKGILILNTAKEAAQVSGAYITITSFLRIRSINLDTELLGTLQQTRFW